MRKGDNTTPQVFVIAGANGAGKSTSAPAILPPGMPYLNADDIAKELSETSGNRDILAARLLFHQWEEWAAQRADFAIETTLASRSLSPRIANLQAAGFQFHLIFFWLASVDLAVARVAERIKRGGHAIPLETIQRRYSAGLRNFFALYQPMADSWSIFDNTPPGKSILVAIGKHQDIIQVYEPLVWYRIRRMRENG